MFRLGGLGHVGGDGANQSVAEQNTEKRPYQGGGNLVSDFFRWPAERSHGDNDAEHGGDNSEAGKGIGHGAEGGGGLGGILMMNLHVEVEHLVEVEGIDAGDRHAQGVTDKIARMMI